MQVLILTFFIFQRFFHIFYQNQVVLQIQSFPHLVEKSYLFFTTFLNLPCFPVYNLANPRFFAFFFISFYI